MILGIEIEPSSLRIAQIEKKYELVNWEFTELPEGVISNEGILDADIFVNTLSKALANFKVKNPKVAFAISGPTNTAVRILKVPYIDRDEIALNLPHELDKHIPFSVKEVYFDFHILSQSKDKSFTEVIVAVANRQLVDEYIKAFEKAGMSVALIDISAIALFNVYEVSYTDNLPVAVINIGENVINFSISRKSKPLFIRDSTHNFNVNIESASEDELRNFADEVAAEIYRQVEYFKNFMEEDAVRKIYITGYLSNYPTFVSSLQERLEQEVQEFNPYKKIKINKKIEAKMKKYSHLASVSMGLSLRGTEKLK